MVPESYIDYPPQPLTQNESPKKWPIHPQRRTALGHLDNISQSTDAHSSYWSSLQVSLPPSRVKGHLILFNGAPEYLTHSCIDDRSSQKAKELVYMHFAELSLPFTELPTPNL